MKIGDGNKKLGPKQDGGEDLEFKTDQMKIGIDDELRRNLHRLRLVTGRTISDMVNEALEDWLEKQQEGSDGA